MPRIVMTEHYTCADGNFTRGREYDVADARARMLTGRGSATLVTRTSPAEAAKTPAPPAAPPPANESSSSGSATPEQTATPGTGAKPPKPRRAPHPPQSARPQQ